MPILPFSEFRPDVSDYEGQTTKNVTGVIPRGDGYGPARALAALSAAAPLAIRGMFFARKADGSVQIFIGVADRLFALDNTGFGWVPVSKVVAVTSITHASPAVVNYTSHGFIAGDPVVFTTGGALPAGLTAGTVYYVISAGLTANAFEVSATVGGSAINTTSNGSGTHSVTAHYSTLSANTHWQFEQFNNFVIAVQQNTVPQVYDLTSSVAFADLGGSPPQASYISIVNRFVVLSGIAPPNVYRVQWSGLNATTTWTSGVTQSDSQDEPDGGIVRGVAGGEFGVIFQDQSIRRMTYAPGSPYIFGIDRISKDDGLLAPYSLIRSGDRIFFLSPQGFKELLPGGYPKPIGKERVDRTFFAEVDMSNLGMVIGATDPNTTKVFWAYKTSSSAAGLFNKIIVYDWALDKWSEFPQIGEFIASLAKPGITLEGVDAAFGSNLDTLSVGSLDDITLAANPALAGADSNHKVGLFSGATVEATMDTPEKGADGRRIFVRGFRVITDAPTVYGSVSARDTAQGTPVFSGEDVPGTDGIIPQRVSTRFSKGRVRIPAGTSWSFATGIEPDVVLEGKK